MGTVTNKENCDGFVNGCIIKKGSIPADRLDYESLKELIEQILKEFAKEDWFKDLICSLGCEGTACTMIVSPASLSFDAEGGDATFTITTNGDWTIKVS